MGFDRKYLICALGYVVLGMGVGVYMGASGNHRQLVAHAHILLVGFVVSFIYAIIHKLWLERPGKGIAQVQFVLHQVAAVVMFLGLLLLYGGVLTETTLGPILGASSMGVLAAALLMIYMVLKSGALKS
ncbi:MAG: TonB-dependent receptor [Proteobacteria bacterium]|uniref:TonB-dependent receptor n=1 Tax=Rudaea sp. TaxID=2136325 RepID=UPI0032208F90|nr:TonB-dependent receptor [Pseudomonadota bacterium]